MSKKYVPSFLKDGALKDGALKEGAIKEGAIKEVTKEGTKEIVELPSRNFSQERSNSTAFSKVSHEYRKEKPVTVEVPKLAPATLASITSLSPLSADANSTSKPSGSFASKFAEQVRISEDPNYQKPVDLSSTDDFPALGAVKKNNVVIPPFKPQPLERRQPTEKPKLTELKSTTANAPSFAEMASLWAKKKEEEDREKAEFQRRKELEEEKMRQAARLMKKVPVLGSIGRRVAGREEGSEEEENVYVNPDEQASLGGGSNYEYEEEESFDDEDDEFGEREEGGEDGEEEEYNPNAGWDGRRKEDLY